MTDTSQKSAWLDRPVLSFFPLMTGEIFVFLLIVGLAIISRFYNLGDRVMSHDENLHVYFSWLLSIGKGYQHTPLMHGPLQFILLAATYLFLGASDFTARFPHAIASVLTIAIIWNWRRYLGRPGAMVAAGLVLISPFLLYYGRYARNEAFIGVFFLVNLFSLLRYLETGNKRYLVLLTIATALHFAAKETAFIYTAQTLIFLAVYLLNRVSRAQWNNRVFLNVFLLTLFIGAVLAGAGLGLIIVNRIQIALDATQTAAPIIPGVIPETSSSLARPPSDSSILFILAGAAFLISAVVLIVGFGWKKLCRERSFDMLILLGTFVLPQLTAFPVAALGWNPLEYQFTWPGWNLSALWNQAPMRTATVFLALCSVSMVIGLSWNKKSWFSYSALFWGIYIILYTSIFTNWQGFFTGAVGSLGYWLQQQGVHRGDQPWYYYLLVQIPLYEFLPALGACLAVYYKLRRKPPPPLNNPVTPGLDEIGKPSAVKDSLTFVNPENCSLERRGPTFPLLLWWTSSSLLAYTIAGEKMPWLTFHISLPMILLASIGFGRLIESINWHGIFHKWSLIRIALLVILFTTLTGILVLALGEKPPFQGTTQGGLATTGVFLLMISVALAGGGCIYFLSRGNKIRDTSRITVLVLSALLAILTIRTTIRAAFVHPNDATEYLVYAHGDEGIKDVVDQIVHISSRETGEHSLPIAYDNNSPTQGVSWSFKWYLRDFPNANSFETPDNNLRKIPIIIVDQKNFENIKPIVTDNYFKIDYIRMVWPNQDYFKINWPRIKNVFTSATLRKALFQIWLNRDYSNYVKATGKSEFYLVDWQPSARMQLYIRKDIASRLWNYSISQELPLQADPYEKGLMAQTADLIIGAIGSGSDEFNSPRGITFASDGTLYIADSLNHRIVHLDSLGNPINTFGEKSPGCPYATTPPSDVPIGTLCEPWAVAISPDGRWIYVADTWNHRIQKFTIEGLPVSTWGTPNYNPASNGQYDLWGPRGITVNSRGDVIVADTGNKRIVVYDADGNFNYQLGESGTGIGQFDEPVGLAIDIRDNLYVADTWNQRVQVFTTNADKSGYTAIRQWDIAGWASQSLDNKPYLAIDQRGHVFVTDPDSFRVLEFTSNGEFVHVWGEYGGSSTNFGMPSGISIDGLGRVWVSDMANNRLMRFSLP